MPPPPGVSQETHIRMKITPTQTGHDQGWQVVNTKHGKRKVLIPQDAPDADGKVVVYAPIAEPEPEELLAPAPVPGPEPAPEASMLPGVPAAGQALPGLPPLPAPESGPPSGRLPSPSQSATRPLESSVQHEMDLVKQGNKGLALTQSQVQEQTVQLLARANAAEQKKVAAKKWVEENNEHISSINTIAAWLLMPALDRNFQTGWLAQKYWWQVVPHALPLSRNDPLTRRTAAGDTVHPFCDFFHRAAVLRRHGHAHRRDGAWLPPPACFHIIGNLETMHD